MIQTDAKQKLREARRELKRIESAIPKAYSAALNRTNQHLRTEASREIREKYNIRARDVNNKNNVILRRSTSNSLDTAIKWRGKNVPLINFRTNPRQVPEKAPRVLRAAVKRSGMKPIKGAFITRVKSGHVGVFLRAGRRRLPIRELYGPAVPVMLNHQDIIEKLKATAEKRMHERLDHEMNRILDNTKGGKS